ncbi:MAG: DUF7620 family protein [Acidimicrobiales bacterium]
MTRRLLVRLWRATLGRHSPDIKPDAHKAIEQSRRDLERARQRWPLIRKITSDMREARDRNNFETLFREALEDRRHDS